MENKSKLGFGARGWILIVVLFTGFMSFQVFSNFPLNILGDFYGGSQKVAMFYTVATLISIVLQIVLSTFIAKIKSVKKMAAMVGIAAMICAVAVSMIPYTMVTVWYVFYFMVNILINLYALFSLSIIAGQWFPRRKGTVMGIATIAYPFTNGVIGLFSERVYGLIGAGVDNMSAIRIGYIPFLVAAIGGFLLMLCFIKDYPEQCGGYRDNDHTLTAEKAKAIMEQEIIDKRTTVWTTKHIFMCRDFWFAAVTCGLILCAAVGTMSMSSAIIGSFEDLNFAVIMMVIAVCGAIGSWILGIIDTAIGTKKSMMISVILMVLAGIIGAIATKTGIGALLAISMILVAAFMGASSNYTVSVAAQYWRREDFSGVFACVNPIANIFNAIAPSIIAMLIASKLQITGVFLFVMVAGIVGVILMLMFNAAHVKKVDDKYRQAAGKVLDDALVGRK
ncbi:MAG: MFS transporter [Eubacterium sp.]|nr:MFS transporter [Eubacterium sp.]